MRFITLATVLLLGALAVPADASAQVPLDIYVSTSPDRSAPAPLEGSTVSDDVYIHILPETGITGVAWSVDGSPFSTEGLAPFDLAGGDATAANPFDTTTITNGAHTVSAVITSSSGTMSLSGSFTVDNSGALLLSPTSLSFTVTGTGTTSANVNVSDNLGGGNDFVASADQPWISVPASGTTPQNLSITVDSTGLSAGTTHTGSVTITAGAFAPMTVGVALTVLPPAGSYDLLSSPSGDRVGQASLLDGTVLSGDIYVFTGPDTGVSGVRFYWDNPAASGIADHAEGAAPYDLGGTTATGDCLPYSTLGLSDGIHTLTAAIDLVGGVTEKITRTVVLANNAPALAFTQTSLSLTVPEAGGTSTTVGVTSTTTLPYDFSLSSDQPWLTATPDAGNTDTTVTLSVDASALAAGAYTANVTATSTTADPATLVVSLLVTPGGGFSLFVSPNPDRSAGISLAGATLQDLAYIFVVPGSGVSRVVFFLDDPTMSGTPLQTENSGPWDLQGGSANAANPYDTTAIADGFHTLTAAVTLTGGGQQSIQAQFLVQNGDPQVIFDPASLSLAVEQGATLSTTVDVATNVGSSASVSLSSPQAWISVDPTGDTSSPVGLMVDAAGLTPGTYTGTIVASSPGLLDGSLSINVTVFASGGTYSLLVSSNSNRSSAGSLGGQNVFGDIHVFASPESGIRRVSFWVDDPAGAGNPYRIENNGPFDLEGGSANSANPFDTTALGDGSHNIMAVVESTGGGTEVVIATFNVANGTPGLAFQPQDLFIPINSSGIGSSQASVVTTDGSTTTYSVTDNADWLTLSQAQGTTGLALSFDVDASGLAPGQHGATVFATAPGYLPATVQITIVVAGSSVYSLEMSTDPALAGGVPLEGSIVSGDIHVFLDPEDNVKRVDWYIDNELATGNPDWVEQNAPYNLNGGSPGSTNPFDTTTLGDGPHSITVVVKLLDGTQEVVPTFFEVLNGAPILQFGSLMIPAFVEPGGSTSAATSLTTSSGAAANFDITTNVDWLTIVPSSGTTPQSITIEMSAVDLTVGTYDGVLNATAPGFGSATLTVHLNVQAESNYDLQFSTEPDRTNPALLDGQEVAGPIFVFVAPEAGLDSVEFYIDSPSLLGDPYRTESNAPFDLAGGSVNFASPFHTSQLNDGIHTLSAILHLSSGTSEVIHATFQVTNQGPTLDVVPGSLSYLLQLGDAPFGKSFSVSTNDGAVVQFAATTAAPWLTLSTQAGNTPKTLTATADPAGLGAGAYTTSIFVSAAGYSTVEIPVVLTLGQTLCAPLPCSELLPPVPYVLTFDTDHGGVLVGVDPNVVGSGFRMILPSQLGSGYLPERAWVDTAAGLFHIDSTAGALSRSSNSQDNAFGVGIDAPSQVTVLETSIVDLPTLTGSFEQVGLWLGIDDRNHVKLFINSKAEGDQIRFFLEVNDIQSTVTFDSPLYGNLTGADVDLQIRVNPVERTMSAAYSVNGGTLVPLGEFSPPPAFFSFDAAGIDPEIGTRTFGGVFASHRNAPSSQTFSFDHFSVTDEPLPPPQTEIAFDKVTFAQLVTFPTSMKVGPDGRLYVLELNGRIKAFTLGANYLPVGAPQIIDSFLIEAGQRLSLGLEIDPYSTPSDVVLWVNTSDYEQDTGDINSGQVWRLSASNPNDVQLVIDGLPRAFANHAPNSLHFGPNGLLYLAIGGNTGSGSSNTSGSEFGERVEQYLSAAMLEADVYGAPSWPIDCFDGMEVLSADDPYYEPSIPNCVNQGFVRVFASGLRNMYDMTWNPVHGQWYGPDNGLGVTGTYPPSATSPCFGPGSTVLHDPGEQPDILLRIVDGMYYGHPNPARGECVFKDGSEQGVLPLANYMAPILSIGTHTSTNGIITYLNPNAFCGALYGDLLMLNYSVGDDLVRVELNADGTAALGSAKTIVTGLSDPLSIAQHPDGVIFVGEFGGAPGQQKITALIPKDTGCWEAGPDMPLDVLDVAGTAVDGLMYVVAGKTPSGPIADVYVYDPVAEVWSFGPTRPGTPVENPAVVADGELIYAFGGSELPFSGMLGESWVLDTVSGVWTQLPDMPTGRGGATVQQLAGQFYVIGGLLEGGVSTNVVEVYDPVAQQWSTAAPLLTARDNPGSSAINGKIYVFGGRTRAANGTGPGTLSSVEMYDPIFGTWTPRTPMPTGRRTFASVTRNGRAIAIGGEATPSGGAFPDVEEYNPVFDTWRTLAPMLSPRHGCAGAVIDGRVYVAGGGIVAGGNFSPLLDILSFPSEE